MDLSLKFSSSRFGFLGGFLLGILLGILLGFSFGLLGLGGSGLVGCLFLLLMFWYLDSHLSLSHLLEWEGMGSVDCL